MNERKGYDKLWLWFGLSYASWLTLPRVFMHAMPDDWQGRMAKLLKEYDEAFDFYKAGLDYETCVSLKRDGRYTTMPDLFSRQMYRHPRNEVIDSFRRKPC